MSNANNKPANLVTCWWAHSFVNVAGEVVIGVERFLTAEAAEEARGRRLAPETLSVTRVSL